MEDIHQNGSTDTCNYLVHYLHFYYVPLQLICELHTGREVDCLIPFYKLNR